MLVQDLFPQKPLAENSPQLPTSNKYELQEDAQINDDEVDNEINLGPDYIPMPKPSTNPSKKKDKKSFPTTDKANNSLINTIWFMNNSDAV